METTLYQSRYPKIRTAATQKSINKLFYSCRT